MLGIVHVECFKKLLLLALSLKSQWEVNVYIHKRIREQCYIELQIKYYTIAIREGVLKKVTLRWVLGVSQFLFAPLKLYKVLYPVDS